MAELSVEIPEIPEVTGDGLSYLSEIAVEPFDKDDLFFRLKAKGGIVRDNAGNPLRVDRDGQFFTTSEGQALKESREVEIEQARVINRINDEVSRNIADAEVLSRNYSSTESYLRQIAIEPFRAQDELSFRLRAKGGVARDSRGTPVRIGPDGDFLQSGDTDPEVIKEDREIPEFQANVVRRTNRALSEALRLKETAFKEIEGAGSYIRQIAAEPFRDQRELNFRLRARRGLARDSRDDPVRRDQISGDLLKSDESDPSALREDREVSSAQADIIRRINVRAARIGEQQVVSSLIEDALEYIFDDREKADLTIYNEDDRALVEKIGSIVEAANGGFDKYRDVIAAIFETGDRDRLSVNFVNQLQEEVLVENNGVLTDQQESAVEAVRLARTAVLRSEFWALRSTGANASDILDSFEALDDRDTAEVDRLRRESLDLLQIEVFGQALGAASGPEQDIDRAYSLLTSSFRIAERLGDTQAAKDVEDSVKNLFVAEIGSQLEALTVELGEGVSVAEIDQKLKEIPVRAAIGDTVYLDLVNDRVGFFREKILSSFEYLEQQKQVLDLETRILELRQSFFGEESIESIIDVIIDLEADGIDQGLQQSLLDELSYFVRAYKNIAPARYRDLEKAQESGIRIFEVEAQAVDKEFDLTKTPEGRNIEAVKNITTRFRRVIMPLFEAIRGSEAGLSPLVRKYTASGGKKGELGPRANFVQKIQELEKQRSLTDGERAYLESVELLSLFNPHLVALAKERPELTSLYLENYFHEQSRRTKAALRPNVYVPNVQLGLGPNGLAAAGELARSNPTISAGTLFIDGNSLPGGPFGVPKGLSWELNSANSIGESTNTLPDLESIAEQQGSAIRSYGSPLVAYPGERNEGQDSRQASINASVDYLLNPDNISTKRYPTNFDEALVLQLQTALVCELILLDTDLISTRKADDDLPGDLELVIAFDDEDGSRVEMPIRTDYNTISSGLGEAQYGFDLKGSAAEQILMGENITPSGFMKLTDTLGAFEVMSSPEGEDQIAPEGVVVIYGSGNSTDVLIEYFGRQFESGNTALNKISKVYVIADGDLSGRPRYAQINDLKARNGQKNFLEFIPARVGDITETADGKLVLSNGSGGRITVNNGSGSETLIADHVISAAGFRPGLDEVYKDLLDEGQSLDRKQGLASVQLPNNEDVPVADQLVNAPNVLSVGTGSRPQFNSAAKLGVLPGLAREALLRNGAENAVAIGFRAPDTRAAVRLKYDGVEAGPSEIEMDSTQKVIIEADAPKTKTSTVSTTEFDPESLPVIRRNVDINSETLTALLLGSIPPLELENFKSKPSEYSFTIRFGGLVENSVTVATDRLISEPLGQVITDAVNNPYFIAYAQEALRGRRNGQELDLKIHFSNGKLVLRDNPAGGTGKRTFVEAR